MTFPEVVTQHLDCYVAHLPTEIEEITSDTVPLLVDVRAAPSRPRPAANGGQEYLGHTRLETTQLYAQIRPVALKHAVEFHEAKALEVLSG